MNKKFFCILSLIGLLYFVSCKLSYCQTFNAIGRFSVVASSKLDSIMSKKLIYDSYNSGYNGYRVQIFFAAGNNSKMYAYYAADKFYKLNLDLPIFITFREPYYRVRVGNFRNRIDADYYKSIISNNFKGSFVVKDFISTFDAPYNVESSILEEKILLDNDIYKSKKIDTDTSEEF